MYLILAKDESAALLREGNATIWAHAFKRYKKDISGWRASPLECSAARRRRSWCNAPACVSDEQASSCLYLERNTKCEMLWPRKQWKWNSSFCLQTQFFLYIWKSISTKNIEFCYIQIGSQQRHAAWNDFFGETAETIQHSDSPLSTIFFSLNEPHAHHEQDGMWAAEKW